MKSTLKDSRDFEITISNPDVDLNLSAEEIAYDAIAVKDKLLAREEMPEVSYTLSLINTSGSAGTAGEVGALLVKNRYYFSSVSVDESRTDALSKIVFDVSLQKEALALSKILDGALLSAKPQTATTTSPTITIYVGKDQVSD